MARIMGDISLDGRLDWYGRAEKHGANAGVPGACRLLRRVANSLLFFKNVHQQRRPVGTLASIVVNWRPINLVTVADKPIGKASLIVSGVHKKRLPQLPQVGHALDL